MHTQDPQSQHETEQLLCGAVIPRANPSQCRSLALPCLWLAAGDRDSHVGAISTHVCRLTDVLRFINFAQTLQVPTARVVIRTIRDWLLMSQLANLRAANEGFASLGVFACSLQG